MDQTRNRVRDNLGHRITLKRSDISLPQPHPVHARYQSVLFGLIQARIYHKHNYKGSHDECKATDRRQEDTASAGRKLALDDEKLSLKIPPPSNQKHNNRDCEERRAKRLADFTKREGRIVGSWLGSLAVLDRDIESE